MKVPVRSQHVRTYVSVMLPRLPFVCIILNSKKKMVWLPLKFLG